MLRMRNLILSLTLVMLLLTSTASADGMWRLDGLDKSEVRNFRITSSNTSASAQLSERSFPLSWIRTMPTPKSPVRSDMLQSQAVMAGKLVRRT